MKARPLLFSTPARCGESVELVPVITHDSHGITVTEYHPPIDCGLPVMSFDKPCRWLSGLMKKAAFLARIAVFVIT